MNSAEMPLILYVCEQGLGPIVYRISAMHLNVAVLVSPMSEGGLKTEILQTFYMQSKSHSTDNSRCLRSPNRLRSKVWQEGQKAE